MVDGCGVGALHHPTLLATDQPLALKAQKGLAHRSAADVHGGRDLVLHQAGAGLDLEGQDLRPEPGVHVSGQEVRAVPLAHEFRSPVIPQL
ncbi:hypothetical protein D3C71_2032210 [compost metagenome]